VDDCARRAALVVARLLKATAPRATAFWVACAPGRTFDEKVRALLADMESAPFDFVVTLTDWYPFGLEGAVRLPDTLWDRGVAEQLAREFFRCPSRYFASAQQRFGRAELLTEFLANDVLERAVPRASVVGWLRSEIRCVLELAARALPPHVVPAFRADFEDALRLRAAKSREPARDKVVFAGDDEVCDPP
jgi:hypothetical protein